MSKLLKRIIAAALLLVMLAACTSCIHIHFDWDDNPFTKSTEEPHPISPVYEVDYPLVVNKDLVPDYREYDLSTFDKLLADLKSAATGTDFEKIKAAYEALRLEVLAISDNSAAAYLEWCKDGANEELAGIYQDCQDISIDCYDKAYIAVRTICEGPCKDQFKAYVGEDVFEEFATYEDMTPQQKEWASRENELVAQYYAAAERYEAREISQSELDRIVGPIYVELVHIRDAQAKDAGYDNYAEYADAEIYCRSYSSEDAEALHKAAKEVAPDVYELLYYSDLFYVPDYAREMDEAEMLSLLEEFADRMDPQILASAKYMVDNGLIDLAYDTKRQNTSFTMTFDKVHTPYIFINESAGENFSTLNHEFGHFTSEYLHPNTDPFTQGSGDFDVLEIHSTGMEILYSHYYSDIYGSEIAPYMEAYELLNLLFCVIDGALYDEFQREIYTHPDMTYEEIDQLYKDLCVEYGDPYADLYWWQQVPHNFESPMYYISYGASAMATLQLWDLSRNDFDKAIDTWKKLAEYNGVDSAYAEALTEAGLSHFTDTKSIIAVLKNAIKFTDKYSDARKIMR